MGIIGQALTGLFGDVSANNGNYYYSRLTDDQKRVYASVQSGIQSYSKRIKLPMRPANELTMLYRAVLADNPLFFYVAGVQWQTDTYKQKNIVSPDYGYSQADISTYTSEIYNHLRIYDTVKNKSDKEKELFVHDYCSEHFTYGDADAESHTVLGLILHKTAVCEGIAKYIKVVLDYLGVSCLVVSGKAQSPLYYDKMETHAWNIVKVDGSAYHLDVTFDMTLKNNLTRHDYFNLCDDDIRKDHVIVGDVPKCVTVGKDFYTSNNMAARGKNGLENYLIRNIKSGKKTIIVKLVGTAPSEDICDKVMQVAGQAYTKATGSGVSLEMSSNLGQMVFEINYK